ncbi:hypothetical protein VAEKB19_3280014 [Vibrio aestuarianus]|nr:hypothetical protein VAEKB19_3280014 [Vibrio aestuarianus]
MLNLANIDHDSDFKPQSINPMNKLQVWKLINKRAQCIW